MHTALSWLSNHSFWVKIFTGLFQQRLVPTLPFTTKVGVKLTSTFTTAFKTGWMVAALLIRSVSANGSMTTVALCIHSNLHHSFAADIGLPFYGRSFATATGMNEPHR
jgi:hypothetical protein